MKIKQMVLKPHNPLWLWKETLYVMKQTNQPRLHINQLLLRKCNKTICTRPLHRGQLAPHMQLSVSQLILQMKCGFISNHQIDMHVLFLIGAQELTCVSSFCVYKKFRCTNNAFTPNVPPSSSGSSSCVFSWIQMFTAAADMRAERKLSETSGKTRAVSFCWDFDSSSLALKWIKSF